MRVQIVALLGVVACDSVLGLRTTQLADGPPPPDAPPDGPPCVANPAVPSDPFVATTPCSGWGTTFSKANAMLAEGSDALAITIDPSAPSFAGCDSAGSVPFDAGGVFVAIDRALTTPSGYVNLSMHLANNGPGFQIGLDTGGSRVALQTSDGATTFPPDAVWNPTAMRFLRMRVDATTHEIVGETSPDAIRWHELARAAGPPPAPLTLTLIAGDDSTEGAGSAAFSHLNDCP